MDEEPLAVRIGAREIYDKLVDLDQKVSRMVDRNDATSADIEDHETRIRVLERARWPLPSLAALVSLGALIVTLYNALN